MAEQPERKGDIEELLAELNRTAKTPAKQRVTNPKNLVGNICSLAYEQGLSDASLQEIIDTVTVPNHLDQASIGSLIRNLYPVGKVSEAVVVKLVGSLGHGRAKPSFTVQAALLKWVVMTYDILENKLVLAQLYSVLFNLLDTIAIRTQLCHVLSLITGRKHVRPFRIQALMELTRQAGNDPPLVGLTRVYKDYYPDVIVGDVTSGRATVFTHPNPEWRRRLGEIQDNYLLKTQDDRLSDQQNLRLTRRGVNGVKIAKPPVIPEVYTSRANESSITLEEIETVDEFVNKLEKIQLPNQLVAAIGDPLLQKLLLLNPEPSTFQRIDLWLLAFFEQQLENLGSEKAILEMLEAIRVYTSHTKRLPPSCLKYLQSMIDSWNGIAGRQVILDLLAYTALTPWQELYESIFQSLEDALLEDGTMDSKIALLNFYGSLLKRWILLMLSEPELPLAASSSVISLINHANTLALTIIQTSQTVNSCSAVLHFYEITASLISNPDLSAKIRIVIPSSELVYTLFFTPSLSNISRLCAVLTIYKRAFETAMGPRTNSQHSYPKDYVNHFNGFLMDLCNCLWRSRAFNTSDMNALGCLLPEPICNTLTTYVSGLDTSLSLPTLFNLSYSPFLCRFAISYVRELEDNAEDEIEARHAGPVTQASLKALERDGGISLPWSDYRLGVLQYLEKQGAPGIGELMYNTMKHLMNARENKT